MAGWLELVTPASAEPLGLTDAQNQVRRFDGDEADILTGLIGDARARVEDVTNRQVMQAAWRLHLDHLAYVDQHGCIGIEVPKPPLVSGTVAITYLDTAGDSQTLSSADYVVTIPSGATGGRAWIRPAANVTWPSTLQQAGAVRVAFTAGYAAADTSAVPRSLRRAMLLLIGHWFQHAEAVVIGTIAGDLPLGVRSLLAPFVSRETQAG